MQLDLNKILSDLKKYTSYIPYGALSLIGDDTYIIDASLILGKPLLQAGKNILETTALDIIKNVASDYMYAIGAGLLGAVGLTDLTETLLNILSNKDTFGEFSWFYKFRINPQKVSINRRKLQTITEYGWGMYDIEEFGDQLIAINVSGTTGTMIPSHPLPSMGISDIRLTPAYIKLAHLEKFYKDSGQKLFFTIYGKVYFGFLEDMSYPLDADNPRKINYTFNFKAHPYFMFDVFTGDFSGLSEVNEIIWEQSARPSVIQEVNDFISNPIDYLNYTIGFP
jgi:hypothetical protein